MERQYEHRDRLQTHYGEVAYVDFFEKLNKGIEIMEPREEDDEMKRVRDAQGKDATERANGSQDSEEEDSDDEDSDD